MMADVVPPGCCAIENVSGNRIATPFAPPKPGNTPMITPSTMPANISIRLNHESATAKPPRRELISCIAGFQAKPKAASSGPLGNGTLNQTSNITKKTTIVTMLTAAIFSQPYLPRKRMKKAMKSAEAT